MAKVIVYLRDQEQSALYQLAIKEYRVPKAQAALIIRKELERLGLLEVESGDQEVEHGRQPAS